MTKTTTYVLSPNEVKHAIEEQMKRIYPEIGQQELTLTLVPEYGGLVSAKTVITETK
jgi:hypothetical protein